MASAAPPALEAFAVPLEGGRRRLDLHVPDLRCAGCIGKVERAVAALPGVTRGRVNFSTRRLTVEWQGSQTTPEAVIDAVERAGFAARPFAPEDAAATAADPESKRLLKAMAVAGFAMMNIMLLSVSVWSGAEAATRDLFHAISALIAIPTLAYSGQPFFRSAAAALRRGRTNMDVPISIGVLLATGMSLHETLTSGPHAWFDGVVMLLFFLLVGRFLDSMMRDRARAGVAQLMKALPRGAMVVTADGATEWRAIDELAPAMRVLVAAGERLPADGIVEDGRSAIDRSLVTGESRPEPAGPGTTVVAGTLNLEAPLVVKVTAVGERSFLGEVIRMMEAAEGGRARHVRIADRASRLYAPVVHLLAIATAAGWLIAGAGWHMAITTAIVVLIITCPCALGLAVPAVQVRAATLLMRRGILLKDGGALERLARVDTVVFDKTGTLTLGRPEPVGTFPLAGAEAGEALALARASRHPLARALASALARGGVAPAPSLLHIRERPGLGLEAEGPDGPVRLGRPDWVDPALPVAAMRDELVLAFRSGERPGRLLRFADPLRPAAREAVARLGAMGLDVRILSGDRAEAVEAAATTLGIATWAAAQTPADKLAAIRALAAAGRRVLVVGDGLNDAPALAAGHASIAPASASDVGQTAADLLFLGDGLDAVPEAIAIARAADRGALQNFALAIGYNALAVPIAIAGLATPLIAALAMSTSSLIVVGNALRLRPARGAAA
ncbi:heavy metal translocating P-type ATPase [Thermaurantiacus tibetensis]|uniref:heavy metal translocating P-type ATPase n=1 Tax=Thermaurantiacus tibetensis TaxID=2759035 RepID=UPI00188E1B1A|nr:heavy metal translocating P-type ATPase [Thermaurantiacus tibetensis]